VIERPLRPEALDHGVRVDERAVHVQQQRGGPRLDANDGCRHAQHLPPAAERRHVPPGVDGAITVARHDHPVRRGRVDEVHERGAVVAAFPARREAQMSGGGGILEGGARHGHLLPERVHRHRADARQHQRPAVAIGAVVQCGTVERVGGEQPVALGPGVALDAARRHGGICRTGIRPAGGIGPACDIRSACRVRDLDSRDEGPERAQRRLGVEGGALVGDDEVVVGQHERELPERAVEPEPVTAAPHLVAVAEAPVVDLAVGGDRPSNTAVSDQGRDISSTYHAGATCTPSNTPRAFSMMAVRARSSTVRWKPEAPCSMPP
jgi:hypothetical protein